MMELTDKEIRRISETLEMIPPGVKSILEVGCGDGRIFRGARDKFALTGIDIDTLRIKSFPGEKIIADISWLPVKNQKPDLVLAAEVLEHLDDDSSKLAIKELMRVTKKYLLVTVPFEENLAAEWCKCSECGEVFHAWGHIRKFSLRDLNNLFEGAKLMRKNFMGLCEAWVPGFMYVIARRFGRVWNADFDAQKSCPKCGGRPLRCEANILGKILVRMIWRVGRSSPFKKPIWIGCLYQKVS